MKEKDLEQKVDDALNLFGLVQKQVAQLNADCQVMMRDLTVVIDSMDGRFSVQDSSMEVKKIEIEEICKGINKRLDHDKRDGIDKGHKKDMKLEIHQYAVKACLINIYHFLYHVSKEAPSEVELKGLKDQINALGK